MVLWLSETNSRNPQSSAHALYSRTPLDYSHSTRLQPNPFSFLHRVSTLSSRRSPACYTLRIVSAE